jgi:hypothetical protein
MTTKSPGDTPTIAEIPPEILPTVTTSLSNSNQKSGSNNTLAEPKPDGYYVIIGRGVTAWYNHLSLLLGDWGKTRLCLDAERTKRLPVMHIGYKEPWSRRGGERMGQWPRMLDFFKGLDDAFGLRDIPAEDEQRDWLAASRFATSIQAVQDKICSEYRDVNIDDVTTTNEGGTIASKIEIRSGFVGVIETKEVWERAALHQPFLYIPELEKQRRRSSRRIDRRPFKWLNPECPYRLSIFHDGAYRYVYAHKIDICTGPGQPRLFTTPDTWNKKFATKELYEEHLPPRGVTPHAPDTRIIDGNEYIGSANDHTKTVLVFKGNPVGAQSVQSALDMPTCASSVKRVFWVSNNDILRKNEADVPGKRNLLEMIGSSAISEEIGSHVATNHGEPWVSRDTRAALLKERLHRVSFHEIDRISDTTNRKIRCSFTLHPYGDYSKPIGKDTPAGAETSVKAMFADADVKAEGATHNRIEGVTTMIDDGKMLLQYITVDLLVYALGQERGVAAEGTARYMTQLLGPMAAAYDPDTGFPMAVIDGRMDVAVDTAGCVRVLGAAIMNACSDSVAASASDTKHKEHGDTLPREAPAGGGGLNLAITNIRRANRFRELVTHVNTASVAELLAAGLDVHCARAIVALRSRTDRGYSVVQLQKELLKFFVNNLSKYPSVDLSQIGANIMKVKAPAFVF